MSTTGEVAVLVDAQRGLARYGTLLRAPQVSRLLSGYALGRLGIGFLFLVVLLAFEQATGSITFAAIVEGGYSVGIAVSSPFLGRSIDRLGARAVLLACAATHSSMLLLAAGLLSADAPYAAAVPAVLAGACIPPLPAALRSRWTTILADRPRVRDTANSVEAVLVESIYLFGPLVAALCAAFGRPGAGLVIAAVTTGLGAGWFALSPACRPAGAARPPDRHLAGPLRVPLVRWLLTASFVHAIVYAAASTAIVAACVARDQASVPGLLFCAAGVVSVGCGLAWGAWAPPWRPGAAIAVLSLPLALAGVLPLALGMLGALMVGVLVAHVGVANIFANLSTWGAVAAPAGRSAETFTWMTTATLLGAAVGSPLGAWFSIRGTGLTLLLCAVTLAAVGVLCGPRDSSAPEGG